MKPFNTEKTAYFVLLPEVMFRTENFGPNAGKRMPAIGSISFRDYTDKAGVFGNSGAAVQYVISKDKFGRDQGKFFTLGQAQNAFQVRLTDTDVHNKSMYDFIANHPWCEGSRNGDYVTDENGDKVQINVKFKLMDSAADAKVALDATVNRAKAQLSAGEIDDQTLLEVAAIGISYHGLPDEVMRHKVVEWAGKRPNDYFEVLNSGERFIKAVIRKAISDGTFSIKGELIYWNNLLIGVNEDAALAYLMSNADQLEALKEKVNLKAPEPKPKLAKKK